MMEPSSSRVSFEEEDDIDDEEPKNKLQSLLDQSDVSTLIEREEVLKFNLNPIPFVGHDFKLSQRESWRGQELCSLGHR